MRWKTLVFWISLVWSSINAEPVFLVKPYPDRPLTGSVGLTISPSQIGGTLEAILNNVWTAQVQHYTYREILLFASIDPAEEYSMTSATLGGYLKFPHFKFGAFTGLGYVDGVRRGNLLNYDSGGCDIWCTGPSSTYEKVEGKALVIPLKFVIGGYWKYVGFGFTPQVYFEGKRQFLNVAILFEAGLL